MISAPGSVRVCFLVDKVFSRSSPLSGTGPAGPSGVFVTVVVVVTLVAGVMEAEGELAEDVEMVDAAAVMEESRESGVLLSSTCVGMVVFMMKLVLFMLTSVGLGDSYSVGGWTSAYRAILVSLHL